MTHYKNLDDYRMAQSARRLRTFLRELPGLDELIQSECRLMIEAIARRYGTELIRQWLDGIVDDTAERLLQSIFNPEGDE